MARYQVIEAKGCQFPYCEGGPEDVRKSLSSEPFEASELPVGAAVVEWLAEYLPAVALGLVVGMMMTVGLAFVWSRFL